MMKSLRFMLLSLLTLVCGTVLAQDPQAVTWAGAESTALPTEIGNDIELTWIEGSADQGPSFNSTKKCASMKNGNKLTIAGADANVTISQIVFTFDSSTNPGFSVNVGSNENNWADYTTTWTGEANSITFTANAAKLIKAIEVTYTGTAAVIEKVPELSITSISNMNTTVALDGEGGKTFVVYYANTGKAAAENAKLTLYVGDVENKAVEIGTIAAGATNQWKNVTYDITKIEKGDHEVYVSLTADGVDAINSDKTTVTFTKADPVAAFSISAAAVTVPYTAESYDVVATLKETNNVAATDVKVELRKGISDVLATQTVETLAANGEAQVTLTVAKDLFETGEKTYNLYVNDKFLATVAVTFEEAPVAEVKDLAITEVIGTLELANTTNNVRVSVKNNGNVDITDAVVTLKAGETVLGTATVSATAGQTGFCQIAVASEGLTAGELAVTATVEVEGDATPDDNTMPATLTVKAIPAAEATFSVTAENVTVAYGATSFEIKATVKNTSEVAANGLTVKLLKGITEVESKALDIVLAAGEETEVSFTVAATEEAPFVAGTTATYYVQAPKAQAEVTVTFEAEPVTPVVAVGLTQISLAGGQIDLAQTANIATVSVENTGNADAEATINMTLNDTALEAQTITVKAESTAMASFTLPTEGLVAGEKATVVASVTVANNTAENTTITKEYDIVDGNVVEPAPVIALNPISSWEVETAGEQIISVSVGVFNNGDADAENVEVKVYKDFGTDLASKTVNIKKGESAIASLSFSYDLQQATTFHVVAFIGNTPVTEAQDFTVSVKQQKADLGLAKIADIKATTEEDVKIAAVVKNNSTIDATEVKVGLYTQGEDFQYQLVGILQTIETVAAGTEANVEFNLGKLAVGTYKYYVRIVTEDDNMDNNMQDVNVTVTEPVVPVVNVALTAIQGISNIDLAAEANTISVCVANEGNVDAEAAVAVKLNETELEAQTISVKAGSNGYATFTLPTEGLTAGEKATVVATVTVADNTAETTTLTREYDIVNSSVATEPVFEVAAENVTVPFGATSFEIKATVKNTSEVAANGLTVKLLKGATEVETKALDIILAAGEQTEVTFTVEATEEAPFVAGRTATYYVQAPKAQAEVTVTFAQEAVAEVKDMAIESIAGTIDLSAEQNNVTVTVKNNGTVDVKDAKVTLNYGETTLEKTVSAKAGEQGYAYFQVASEGIEGETLAVTATVELEGDATPADNTMEATLTVQAAPVAEPTFSVAAADVTVAYGATSFEIKATVKNTSEVAANGLTVKLLKGITEVETKALDIILAAGEETEVTFTVEATEEAPFVAGTTATYYVQVENKAQAEVTVTFAEQAVEQKVDLAITAISGALSLEVETNYLAVFVENKGTVDVNGATVALTANGVELGTATVSAKAGNTGFCSIAVPATALTAGEFTVVATVTAEGDVDEENNTMEKTYTIEALQPTYELIVDDVTGYKGDVVIEIPVTVKNTSSVDAEMVEVGAYYEGGLLGSFTIQNFEANSEESDVIEVSTSWSWLQVGTYQILIRVGNVEKWIDLTVLDGATGIAAIKAQYGEDVQIYTINGQKVNTVGKGLYIVNGKKIMVK